jgi:hypothetical protein
MVREEILKCYNQLIRMNVEEMQIWKKGNYEFKQKQIDQCKKDIEFYKSMKKRFI